MSNPGVSRTSLLGRLKGSLLVQNAATLYGAHFVGLALPLIAIPYLARVLRPEGWGLVVFAQSFGAWLALVVEYGFFLSGTREVAYVRGDPGKISRIVARVQSAKVLLLCAASVLGIAAYLFVPIFRDNPLYLLWAWLGAVIQGFSPMWYFQGIERVRFAAVAEASAKAAATVGLFVLVTGPGDGLTVLILHAATGFLWVFVATAWIYRDIPFTLVGVPSAIATLRDSLSLFIFRSASGAYIVANSFILGIFASVQVVAYFGGAERIIRGAVNLIHPITQVIYPRVSRLILDDKEGAGRLLGISLVVVGGFGILLGAAAFIAAPVLVRVLLGAGYEAAVPVLRALSFLPPIIAVNTVVGIQWAIPMGYERYFYSLLIVAAGVNVIAAIALVPPFGALGMAGAVLLAESIVVSGLLFLAWRKGRELWGAGFRTLRIRKLDIGKQQDFPPLAES